MVTCQYFLDTLCLIKQSRSPSLPLGPVRLSEYLLHLMQLRRYEAKGFINTLLSLSESFERTSTSTG